MINYIKMKCTEWKVKTLFYTTILLLFENQEDILEFLQKLYIALKDVPAENIQSELISKLVEIVHEDNRQEK